MPPVTVATLTERELIDRIRLRLPRPPDWVIVGIGDDAAVVEPARNRLEVLSVDALVDGVHIDRRFTPPAAIGHRALAVNLSDLAAMGAEPRLALLSVALPPALPVSDFDEIVAGLTELAARYRLTVVGGNLTRTDGPLVIDVTVVGTAKRRQVLTRAGARPGDELYVTGSVGSASAGLQKLKTDHEASAAEDALVRRFLFPEPRVRLGWLVGRNRAATACLDLSDGLAQAAHQLAEASGVGVVIEADWLPIDPGAREWFESQRRDAVDESVAGGDDYELLLAVRPRLRRRLAAAERHGDTPITKIGACTADRDVLIRRHGADHRLPRGFAHFR